MRIVIVVELYHNLVDFMTKARVSLILKSQYYGIVSTSEHGIGEYRIDEHGIGEHKTSEHKTEKYETGKYGHLTIF